MPGVAGGDEAPILFQKIRAVWSSHHTGTQITKVLGQRSYFLTIITIGDNNIILTQAAAEI